MTLKSIFYFDCGTHWPLGGDGGEAGAGWLRVSMGFNSRSSKSGSGLGAALGAGAAS